MMKDELQKEACQILADIEFQELNRDRARAKGNEDDAAHWEAHLQESKNRLAAIKAVLFEEQPQTRNVSKGKGEG